MVLNGINIGTPTHLRVLPVSIEVTERTASGRLVADIIAYKREVDVLFELIPDDLMQPILEQLESKVFHMLEYDDPGSKNRATISAKVKNIDTTLAFSSADGNRYWEKVRLIFVEQ